MIELQLSTRPVSKPIVLFDGHVIEFFYDNLSNESRRMHIGHVKSIEIVPVSQGKEKYSLQIKGEYAIIITDVNKSVLPKAQQLVAAIRQAMTTLGW